MATGRASAWSSTINTLNKFCSTHLDHNRLQSFELFQGNNKLRTKVSKPKSHLLIVDDKGKKKKKKKITARNQQPHSSDHEAVPVLSY